MSIPHIYILSVLLLIYTGVFFRKKRHIHVPIMLSCFILDMAAVLYLEINRGVIFKALERVPETLMKVHLTFAITTLSCYAIALYTGRMLLKNKVFIKKFHRFNAVIFLVARTGVFVTSLWIPA